MDKNKRMDKAQEKMMRTYKQILEKIEKHKEEVFGFISDDLIDYLDWKLVEPYLNKDVNMKELKAIFKQKERDKKSVIKEMSEYMSFALGKAENHRGLSANRSIDHYRAWIWLLGDKDFETIDWENYQNYGVPILRQICEIYKFKFPDEECLQNMSQGRKCNSKCSEGCGK